jgi:hypothetical protein
MSVQVASAPTPILRGIALWIFGLAVGCVGGFAMLTFSPAVGLPELLLWIWFAVRPPRFAGLLVATTPHVKRLMPR